MGEWKRRPIGEAIPLVAGEKLEGRFFGVADFTHGLHCRNLLCRAHDLGLGVRQIVIYRAGQIGISLLVFA